MNVKKANIQEYFKIFGKTIGLQMTLECPLECGHCIVESGPDRNEELDFETAVDCVHEIGKSRLTKVISITGGEPFAKSKKLKILTDLAREYHLLVNVVTSAYWAKSHVSAARTLDRFAGITHLCISADIFHAAYVPLNHVKNAAVAALDRNMVVAISVCFNENNQFIKALGYLFGQKLVDRFQVVPQQIHAVGRAKLLGLDEEKKSPGRLPLIACGNLSSPFVLCNGEVMGCCGDASSDPHRYPPLMLGDLAGTSIRKIIKEADRNYLIHALRLWGPAGLYKRINSSKLKAQLKKQYPVNNICELCCDMLSSSEISAYLARLLKEPELRREIALGRSLQYGEVSMLPATQPL